MTKTSELSIETSSGKFVNPLEPDIDSIDINDIAWSLSRISRFAGHTITTLPYNVAQHSVFVYNLIKQIYTKEAKIRVPIEIHTAFKSVDSVEQLYLKGLLHDAHEIFLGDVPSPIKKIPEIKEIYSKLENKLDIAIYFKFGLTPLTADEALIIKFADMAALAIEAYHFMPSRGNGWFGLPEISLVALQSFNEPKSSIESFNDFINAFYEIRLIMDSRFI